MDAILRAPAPRVGGNEQPSGSGRDEEAPLAGSSPAPYPGLEAAQLAADMEQAVRRSLQDDHEAIRMSLQDEEERQLAEALQASMEDGPSRGRGARTNQ